MFLGKGYESSGVSCKGFITDDLRPSLMPERHSGLSVVQRAWEEVRVLMATGRCVQEVRAALPEGQWP